MVIEEAKTRFGDDFNVDESSVFYKLVSCIVIVLVYLEDKFLAFKSARNIFTAQDDDLDDLLTNELFFRKQGSRAEGIMEISGDNGTFIDVGEIEVLGTNNKLYTNIEVGEIASGKLQLKFASEDVGSDKNLTKNNIFSVQKAPYAVRNVQNITEMLGGTDRESDPEYLKRYLDSRTEEAWTKVAIKSNIEKLEGVISCSVENNRTMIDGNIPKKSIKVVVDGGNDEEIAQTISNCIHTANTVGDIKVVATNVNGSKEDIYFSRPKATLIDYKYDVVGMEEGELKTLVSEYLNNTKSGEIISSQNFRKAMISDSLNEVLEVLEISFKRRSESTYKNYFTLNFDEKGEAGEGVKA